MKTIGLIGGTSWHSTIEYYRVINETVNARSGSSESAPMLIYSVNFGEIVALTERQDWEAIGAILSDAAVRLEKAGAECLLLGANTMHISAGRIQSAINIPLIHIADVTVGQVSKQNCEAVLLLGTKYTMLGGFYESRLRQSGIRTIIPAAERLDAINRSIYDELGKGIFSAATKNMYLEIIRESRSAGASGVIMGCTEIPLLLKQEDSPLPLFDTTTLHALAAVDFASS
jgi:aspartate racemase